LHTVRVLLGGPASCGTRFQQAWQPEPPVSRGAGAASEARYAATEAGEP